MPNRILKESICTSENIDQLSSFQETVFYRLLVNCDDYGRMDARPKILAARLFPLKDIRAAQMEDAILALTSAELVTLYEVGGKPFLQMKKWDRHQTIRTKKSKYPDPTEGESICLQMKTDVSKCCRNPIQSESKYESESNEANASCAEPLASGRSTPEPTPSEFDIPLADGTTYNVPIENIEVYRKLYPGVDIEQALRNMIGWCMSHERERKTARGVKKYITGWLTRDQDRGQRGYSSQGGGVNRGGDSKPAGDDADLWAGMSEDDIKLVEQLANDGEHYG